MTSPASALPPAAASPASAVPPAATPSEVDPTTRLVFARLASGGGRLADTRVVPARPPWLRGTRLGSTLFPSPRPDGKPTRMEVGALAAALVAATFVGAAMPGSRDAQAQASAAVPVATVPAAAAQASAPAAPTTTASGSDTASAGASTDTTAASASEPLATPSAAADSTDSTEPAAGDDADSGAAGDQGDGSDPLAGTGDHLEQVALVIVHGDAPATWPGAPAGSPAKARSAKGTTFTGLATLPGAPLATALGLIAGQAPNALTRAGCADAAAIPLAPGTIDDLGRVAGAGCDYPSGTPSLPSAVAIDGRRWKAYAPVAVEDVPGALCGTGTPAGASQLFAATSALRRLGDLTSSGACEGAAAPLSALATDLAAAEPPAWLLIEVGACAPTGCDQAAATARDRDLDETLATLTGNGGLNEASAVIVVGDGTAPGLDPAPAGSLTPTPGDTGAPAAVLSGALLLGRGVTAGATDALPLDPYAIARTQADWLGVDAPGWAKAEGVSGLAIPAG